MANQPEVGTYDAGIYQYETTDPIQGGLGGLDNRAFLQLANRTGYLKGVTDALLATTALQATLLSPAFTGTPTAPNVTGGDSSLKIANTNFVRAATNGLSAVNVAGAINVTLTQLQWSAAIVILTGAITANIAVIFPTQTGAWLVSNQTTGAFTVTCKTAAGAGVTIKQGKQQGVLCDGTGIIPDFSDFDNVALTGSPTAPTPTAGDSSTAVATTAFVGVAILGQPHGVATFTASGTVNWTVPAGVYFVDSECWGSGAGGSGGGPAGGSGNSWNAGVGGNSGGYSRKRCAVTPGQVISITVAAGGAASANYLAGGGAGGTSSFGSFHSATGGTASGPGSADTNAQASGNAGYGVSGDFIATGSIGMAGIPVANGTYGPQAAGGIGGSAPLGGGGGQGGVGSNGGGGGFPGGGGGGGDQLYIGAAGAGGQVIVRW